MDKTKREPFQTLKISRIISEESLGGIILIGCIIIAMIWANSSYYDLYHYIWEDFRLGFVIGKINMVTSAHHWINDGLMAVFFFTVGLEIKREIIGGELTSIKKASLPISAAIGGMVVPAALYALVAGNNPELIDGWGIPMATDIAFALGLISMLGKRVNINLKIFLLALAIADDLGAVLVIAFFYTDTIDVLDLVIGGSFLLALVAANLLGIRRTLFYGLVGFLGVWLAFFYSGVHATIAGVLIALTIPAKTKISSEEYMDDLCRLTSQLEKDSTEKDALLSEKQADTMSEISELSYKAHTPLQKLEHTLHPVSAYFILPLFALSNAGVRIEGNIMEMIFHPVALGIIAGLLIGKPLGISLASRLMVKLKLASLPDGVKWKQIYGVSFLGGIGFTMSMFISELAFDSDEYKQIAKVGIFIASVLASVIGMVWLSRCCRVKEKG